MSRAGRGPLAALREAATTLRAVDARFALVGGLAVSVRGEVRFTQDVDLAVAVQSDEEAEALVRRLGARGYTAVTTVEQRATGRLATVRLTTPKALILDLLFASCGIEPEIVAAAETLPVPGAGRLPVATREHLVAMKVLSAVDERPHDRVDLCALLAHPVDLGVVRAALALIQTRGFGRRQDLNVKLDAALGWAGRTP